jgi:acyl-CoA thioesterase
VSPFDAVTTWTPDGDGWTAELPPDWMQGRGAYGGLVAAAALRAMRSSVEGRPARSVSVTFLGPVTVESARLTTRVLRHGRSITFVEARIEQAGTERAVVIGAFGGDRSSEAAVQAETVTPPDPEGVQRFPYVEGLMPAFTQHFDMRFSEGWVPFSTSEQSVLAGLVRFEAPPARGEERLLGLLDAFPAPTLQQLSKPAPASTVTWTAHLVAPDSVEPGAYCFYRGEAITAANGYTSFVARLWGPDGRLLGWVDQLAALFG